MAQSGPFDMASHRLRRHSYRVRGPIRLTRCLEGPTAQDGTIFIEQHAIRSSSAVKLKACLRIGRGSLLCCELVLLWVCQVAFSGVVSAITGLPVSMDVSKVSIVIMWHFCTSMCSYAVGTVAFADPGRRLNVFRLGVFVYHVFLRCVALLLFVKAKR